MTWRDRTFCADSGECANTECMWWVDFSEPADEAISLARFKTEQCGWVSVIGPESDSPAL